MTLTNLALGSVFFGAAVFALFAVWAGLILGHQTAWRWVAGTLARHKALAIARS